MSNRTSTARLKQDYLRLKRDPVPYISAEPLPANILEWHYVVRGPKESPYYGGYYHGHLVFPSEFPFKPPAIYMRTPNGRFKTNTRLCLSISGNNNALLLLCVQTQNKINASFFYLRFYKDFHPDTWNPAWSVATILTGLLSFMLEQTPTYGSTVASVAERKQLARESLAFNLRNEMFCELFPEVVAEIWTSLGYAPSSSSSSTSSSTTTSETPKNSSSSRNRNVSSNNNSNRNNHHQQRQITEKTTTTMKKGQKQQPTNDENVDTKAQGEGQLLPPPGWVPLNANEQPDGAAAANEEAGPRLGLGGGVGEADNWQSVFSNVLVLAGFAIFAYVANHVFKNISQE